LHAKINKKRKSEERDELEARHVGDTIHTKPNQAVAEGKTVWCI